MMEFLFLATGLLLGVSAGYLLFRLQYAGKREAMVPREEMEAAMRRAAELERQLGVLEVERRRDGEALEKAEVRQERQAKELREALEALAAARERIQNLEADVAKGKQELEGLLKRNKAEFENLARKLLEENAEKFTTKHREGLEGVLKPFQQKIQEFRERVETTNEKQDARFIEFQRDLKNLKDLNRQISQEANALANALRGESKTQGIWGEMLLEKILEKSGLVAGEEYTTQGSYSAEIDGETRRVLPDVVVHLPGDRQVVIDSKVSLKAFTEYANAADDAAAEAAAKAHVLSVSSHIKGITVKNYQEAHGLSSLDFILVFIPVEAAFNLALARDTALYDTAFEKNIVIVTPSTLLATLRVVENLWRQEKQNRNALRIAKEAGNLYNKFVGFLEDMKALDQRLRQARDAFDAAENKLTSGKGNLIGRTEKLKDLGARTAKALPAGYELEKDEDG